jgi:hypothetical protein
MMMLWLVPLLLSRIGLFHQQSNAGAFAFAVQTDLHPMNRAYRPISRASYSLAMSKQDSPSAQRNKQPIWDVLVSRVLPIIKQTPPDDKQLRVLEVAAGCGVHTEYFALQMSKALGYDRAFTWYPTDPMLDSLESIQCYINDNSDLLSKVVVPPMFLTLNALGIHEPSTKTTLSALKLDLIICINMIHISPWEATLGLMKMAGESLTENGCLYCYGPYKIGGTAVASNL